jgi:hypothetical protein|tara:strand:+ start:590 stop:871 length:282 start_codon:yes stop_codon:yes gene_type:complete
MATNLHIVNNETIEEKEKHITSFIKNLAAVEEAMEPFKESKRDLRQNYVENGWLTKEELRMAVRAYRLMKNDTDMDQLLDFFKHVKKTVGTNG